MLNHRFHDCMLMCFFAYEDMFEHTVHSLFDFRDCEQVGSGRLFDLFVQCVVEI